MLEGRRDELRVQTETRAKAALKRSAIFLRLNPHYHQIALDGRLQYRSLALTESAVLEPVAEVAGWDIA